MKTFIGILLVGLLGFSGCSSSDEGTSAVIGEAIPIEPYGLTDSSTPTFTWIQVPDATHYCLLIKDDLEETIIEECYTLTEGLSHGEPDFVDFFSVTPEVEVVEATWCVRACVAMNCGPWSPPVSIFVGDGLQPNCRYQANGDDTVWDLKTRLQWSQNADRAGRELNHDEAIEFCNNLTLGNHDDWRSPNAGELMSLYEWRDLCYGAVGGGYGPIRCNPSLMPGHPFWWVKEEYWTNKPLYTKREHHPPQGWITCYYGQVVNFSGQPLQQVLYDAVLNYATDRHAHAWCLRGPRKPNPQSPTRD